MTCCSIEPRARKYIKGNGFLSFARNLFNICKKQWLDTGLDALKTACKKVVHKAAEATSKFLGNKITDVVARLYDDKIVKTKPVEEIYIPPEKREEIFKELR